MNNLDVRFEMGFPAQMSVFAIGSEPFGFYQRHPSLLLILAGKAGIASKGRTKVYTEKSIVLVDAQTPVIISDAGCVNRRKNEKTSDEITPEILKIDINADYYNLQFPYLKCTDFADLQAGESNNLYEQLLDVACALLLKEPDAGAMIDFNMRFIVSELLDHCQSFCKRIAQRYANPHTRSEYVSLMQNIMNFIDDNYDRKISLSDFAEKEHYNTNYLSHLIKTISGSTFTDLTAYLRCRKAAVLLNTSLKVSNIALLTGFTSSASFRRHFTNCYSVSPESYRENYLSSAEKPPHSFDTVNSKLKIEAFAEKHGFNLSQTKNQIQSIDYVPIDHYIEYYHNPMENEGMVRNINAEITEDIHQAFLNLKKVSFRMKTITIDVAALQGEKENASTLTIAKNISHLIDSGFDIKLIIFSLSPKRMGVLINFIKFYASRFTDTLEEISLEIRAKGSYDESLQYKKKLSRLLRNLIGINLKVKIVRDYDANVVHYFPSIYDSYILAPFAADELIHPENWKQTIAFSLIDPVDQDGKILAGGDGLLCWNGIKKPWWHLYVLMNKLRGNVISKGHDHIITNRDENITILSYNTCGLKPSFLKSIKSNDLLYDAICSSGYNREHIFRLSNIYGKYQILTYELDDTACLFSKWALLGYPEYISTEIEMLMDEICHPSVTFNNEEVDGKIDIITKEKPFGVTCVVMEKY